MKISKKVVVSALSTTMAVAFVAALTGTVAWYQFNTRVSTTTIGTNVADTGALQISTDEINWGRDLITKDLVNPVDPSGIEFTPVTFGAMNRDGSIPSQAYMKPEASENGYATNPGSYAEVYQPAEANKQYIQYTVYIRAQEVNNVSGGVEQVEKDVFLSDITFQDVDGQVASGLRAHLAIDTDGNGKDDKFLLLSKDGVTDLQLSGVLDLDGNGNADHVGGPEWNANRDNLVIYGNEGEVQNADAASAWKVNRESNGSIDAVANASKKLFTTLSDKNVKVKVTLWMEGWDTSVGSKNINMDRLQYRKVQVSDATGYFKKTGQNYIMQTSGAVASGVKYYEVNPELIDPAITSGEPLPENAYRLNGQDYEHCTGNSDGGDYYALYPLEVNLDTPEEITAKLPGLLEKTLSGDYVKTDDLTCNSNKTYYELVNNDVEYTSKSWINENSTSKSVSGLFRLDSDSNYVKASSSLNVKGVNYIAVTPTAYNPTLTEMEDNFVNAEKMTGLNVYTLNGSGEYVKHETAHQEGNEYYKVEDNYVITLDKFATGSFDVPEGWYKKVADEYLPVSVDEWNESGVVYYTDDTGSVEATLASIPSDTFDVPNTWFKANADGGYDAVGTEKNDSSKSYFTSVTTGANPTLSDVPAFTLPSGWFTYDGADFHDASGSYDAAETYYKSEDLLDLVELSDLDGLFNVDGWYIDDGEGGYDLVSSTAFDSSKTYYTSLNKVDATVADIPDHSFVTIESWYKEDSSNPGNFIQVTHHEKNVAGTHYFKFDNNSVEYTLGSLESDAIADLAAAYTSGTLYTYNDASKTYSPVASGANDAGVTYYELDVNAYNPTLSQLPSNTVDVGKLYAKHVYWDNLNGVYTPVASDESNVIWNHYYTLDVAEHQLADNLLTGSIATTGLFVRDTDGKYISLDINSSKNIKGTEYYELTNYGTAVAPMWSGENTDGASFRFGLTFDVGKTAFDHN